MSGFKIINEGDHVSYDRPVRFITAPGIELLRLVS